MSAAPDDDTTPAGRPVDQFDLEIVEFVVRWAPYGGPPVDECLPRFGMSLELLRARFRDIVRNPHRGDLDGKARALLKGAALLLVVADYDDASDADASHRPADESSRPLGKPVLRGGVWRWV